jgi:NodT family efflux transporter outer membrane factor (OMF) lipoprotein
VSDDVTLAIPERWENTDSSGRSIRREDLANWWRGFGDADLDELVRVALAANHDLKLARERVREARAGEVVALSQLFPTVNLTAAKTRSKDITRPIPIVNNETAGLVASWEIDLFGGNRLETEAASAQALAAEESHRAVLVGLLAEVARNYLQLRSVQEQIQVLERNIAVQQESLRLIEARFAAGLASAFDVSRAKTLLKTSESSLPALQADAATKTHRLGVLVGEQPAYIGRSLASAKPLPALTPAIPDLLPSELLTQRPDLRRARQLVTAAAASAGAARTDLFPAFLLSTSIGRQSAQLGSLPWRSAGVFALGAGLVQPLFNAGRIRAGIDAADARFAEATVVYEKSFLEALEDVENAFVLNKTSRERQENLAIATESAERAQSQASVLYEKGVVDYLAHLDAQRTALASEDALIRALADVALSLVGLYRAFGGGWSIEKGTSGLAMSKGIEQSEFSALKLNSP